MSIGALATSLTDTYLLWIYLWMSVATAFCAPLLSPSRCYIYSLDLINIFLSEEN